MTTRSYGQYCGLAQALDLVGERWALLVVRELLFGPKRYSDLMAGLPGISTNVLAGRLDELERAGIVRHGSLSPPAASAVYELTAYGRELEEAILALGRWGGRSLGSPDAARTFLPGWGLLALRASFRPERARGLRGRFEFRVGGETFQARLGDGDIEFRAGSAQDPDLVMTADVDGFLALGLGELDPSEAIANGRVTVTGDPKLLARLFEAFRFPAADPPAVSSSG